MKNKVVKSVFAVCLSVTLMGSLFPMTDGMHANASSNLSETVESGLTIKESEINQLLTGDLVLPDSVDGLENATISYSVGNANANYVSVDGTTLKVTRPYAGDGNYSFTLTATVTKDGTSYEKTFSLTIEEGLSDDSYAGYIYTCFSANSSGSDVQQLHFFLSQDGLNWTALNGCNPAFLTGTDYIDQIKNINNVNYQVKSGTDVTETTSGDASVLFPFEGDDQGVRDPYIIRGCKADGSDSNKVFILATDLNTMASKYSGSLANNAVGSWGTMASAGSTSLFVYETEDFVNWERRYIDVGSEINAGAAWAPEAVYNPEKDNYLVYWSCRVTTDGLARNRLYCNETSDFVTFGPTKMYEEEDFYNTWGELVSSNDGYGNIDTSQLWVADDSGNPYGTLFRVVKDETDNHIQLMSASSVLDPSVDYDSTDPNRITPYTLDGTTYQTLSDITSLDDFTKADVVFNWFKAETTGNHFQYISQKNMESMSGAYEGATMFKFIDRDEWCVMIDYYGNNSVRYEPYTTYDLSEADSITKVTSGYGRTGGDVGCHGGMIPITVKEYNTLINTYNADSTVSNYHDISYIEVDKRALTDAMASLKTAATKSTYTDATKAQMNTLYTKAEALNEKGDTTSEEIALVVKRANYLVGNTIVEVPSDTTDTTVAATKVTLNKTALTLGVKGTATLTATVSPAKASQKVTYTSSNTKVATVSSKGVVTAKKAGTATITAKTANGKKATCKVTVKEVPTKVTLNKTALTLGVKETATLTATVSPAKATQKVTYTSSNTKVATVSSKGVVTAKKAGTATITAKTANGKKATCKVTVKKAPGKVIVNKTKITIKKGKAYKLKVTLPKGTASNKITFTSSNKKVVTVSSTGKVTAKKKGTATITVKTYNGKKVKVKITVK